MEVQLAGRSACACLVDLRWDRPLAEWDDPRLLPLAHGLSRRLASPLRTVWSSVLPQAKPGVFTAGIFTSTACWTEFLMALSFIFRRPAVVSELTSGAVKG